MIHHHDGESILGIFSGIARYLCSKNQTKEKNPQDDGTASTSGAVVIRSVNGGQIVV
jgi:hypothetical protein